MKFFSVNETEAFVTESGAFLIAQKDVDCQRDIVLLPRSMAVAIAGKILELDGAGVLRDFAEAETPVNQANGCGGEINTLQRSKVN